MNKAPNLNGEEDVMNGQHNSLKYPGWINAEAQEAIRRNDQEALIALGVRDGVFLDMRPFMPMGYTKSRKAKEWPKRDLASILGTCFHQNGSGNSYSPVNTGAYHASPDNHITPGRPLAGICYDFATPDITHSKFKWPGGFKLPNGSDPNTAWLVSDLTARKYAQRAPDSKGFPGDENTHLMSCLVMGGHRGPGYRGVDDGPSKGQWVQVNKLWDWLQCAFDFGWCAAFGHYDFGKAACPGYAVMEWIEQHRVNALDLETAKDWQEALLRWDSGCLPRFGADGDWGKESKGALVRFQQTHKMAVTALQDPFTELMLLHRYPPLYAGTAQAWARGCAKCGRPSYRPKHSPLLKVRCGTCGALGCKECHGGGCCPACGTIL